MAKYRLKSPKVIEDTVFSIYKKIEHGVVGAYQKVERKFIDTFLEETDSSSEASKGTRHRS